MLYSLSAHWLQHSAKKQKSQEAKINKHQQENTIHKSQESQSHKSHTGKQKKNNKQKKSQKKHEKNIALQKKTHPFDHHIFRHPKFRAPATVLGLPGFPGPKDSLKSRDSRFLRPRVKANFRTYTLQPSDMQSAQPNLGFLLRAGAVKTITWQRQW